MQITKDLEISLSIWSDHLIETYLFQKIYQIIDTHFEKITFQDLSVTDSKSLKETYKIVYLGAAIALYLDFCQRAFDENDLFEFSELAEKVSQEKLKYIYKQQELDEQLIEDYEHKSEKLASEMFEILANHYVNTVKEILIKKLGINKCLIMFFDTASFVVTKYKLEKKNQELEHSLLGFDEQAKKEFLNAQSYWNYIDTHENELFEEVKTQPGALLGYELLKE